MNTRKVSAAIISSLCVTGTIAATEEVKVIHQSSAESLIMMDWQLPQGRTLYIAEPLTVFKV